MASDPKRAELKAEIDELQREQLDTNDRATFIGWTPKEKAEHDKRAESLTLLRTELALLRES